MALSTSAPVAAAPRHGGVSDRRPERRRGVRGGTAPYAFVAPFFLVFIAFGLFPLLYTAWVSLHRVDLQNPDKSTWVGLDNFVDLLHDSFFWNALKNTFTLGVLSTVPQLMIAIGLAHLLNYQLRARTFFRVSMLMPYATSVAAATLVFSQLYDRDGGLINRFLGMFGVHEISWESGSVTSQIALATIVTWRWTGYNALIYLAAMQSIPADLYEAASLDGASRWRQFVHVTVPSLRPTILFTIVISTIGATQLFAEPLLFGGVSGPNGGASRQYQTLGLYLYQTGWVNFHLGRAAAIAWSMFLLVVLLVVVNALVARRRLRTTTARAEGATP